MNSSNVVPDSFHLGWQGWQLEMSTACHLQVRPSWLFKFSIFGTSGTCCVQLDTVCRPLRSPFTARLYDLFCHMSVCHSKRRCRRERLLWFRDPNDLQQLNLSRTHHDVGDRSHFTISGNALLSSISQGAFGKPHFRYWFNEASQGPVLGSSWACRVRHPCPMVVSDGQENWARCVGWNGCKGRGELVINGFWCTPSLAFTTELVDAIDITISWAGQAPQRSWGWARYIRALVFSRIFSISCKEHISALNNFRPNLSKLGYQISLEPPSILLQQCISPCSEAAWSDMKHTNKANHQIGSAEWFRKWFLKRNMMILHTGPQQRGRHHRRLLIQLSLQESNRLASSPGMDRCLNIRDSVSFPVMGRCGQLNADFMKMKCN